MRFLVFLISTIKYFFKGPLLKKFLMFGSSQFLHIHFSHLFSQFNNTLIFFTRTFFLLWGNVRFSFILRLLLLILSNRNFVLFFLLNLPTEVQCPTLSQRFDIFAIISINLQSWLIISFKHICKIVLVFNDLIP